MVGFSAPSSVLSTPSSIVFIHGWYFHICTHKRIMRLLHVCSFMGHLPYSAAGMFFLSFLHV